MLQLFAQNPTVAPAMLNIWTVELAGYEYEDAYAQKIVVSGYATAELQGYPLWTLRVEMVPPVDDVGNPDVDGDEVVLNTGAAVNLRLGSQGHAACHICSVHCKS